MSPESTNNTTGDNNNTLLWSVAAAVAIVAISLGLRYSANSSATKKKQKQEETWESHVDPDHGPLEEVYPGVLYRLEAPGCDMGPPIRNMTIYRVPNNNNEKQTKDRKLVLYSAIAVREDTLQEILALGTPAVMIVPNHMHRCCAGVWQRRFPTMTVVCVGASCPANSRSKIEDIVTVDMTTTELVSQPEWKDYMSVKQIDGWAYFEEILEVTLTTTNNDDKNLQTKKAMIVCDLLFTMPYNKNANLFERVILWFFDSCIELPEPSAGSKIIVPKVSRVARIFGILDWTKAHAWYQTYAAEQGKNIFAILVGHGPPVVELDPAEGCTKALEGVADQLVKPRW